MLVSAGCIEILVVTVLCQLLKKSLQPNHVNINCTPQPYKLPTNHRPARHGSTNQRRDLPPDVMGFEQIDWITSLQVTSISSWTSWKNLDIVEHCKWIMFVPN